MNDVANKAFTLLEGLAGKLGQAVETLWPAAVRYVAVEALCSLVGWLTFGTLLATVGGLAVRFILRNKGNHDVTNELAVIVVLAAFFGCLGAAAIFVWAPAVYLPIVLEPTGYLATQALRGRTP